MNSFILWGSGSNSDRLLNDYCIPLADIEMVVDASDKKQGKEFYGKIIKSPNCILENNVTSKTIVIGTSKYYFDVVKMLKEFGWKYEIEKLDDFVQRYPRATNLSSDYYYDNYDRILGEKMLDYIQSIGPIKQENMKNSILLANRNEGIKRLPKGGKVAEVGVAYGDFTDILLKELNPDHFYAIDYFNKDNPYIQMWGRQELVESGLTHEEWYRNKYRSLIDEGKMTVCSGLSWQCLSEFEDDFFDFVYVDACHDYESILKDTEIVIKKTKHNGIIQFNDYTVADVIGKDYYGVIPVVNKMIKDTNSQVLFYCLSTLGYSDVTVRLNKE